MEFTADNLDKAVTLFYRSEAGQQAQAHQWLTKAQESPQAWSFVWELLQPHRSSEVQFFAATTLHTKILKFWNEVPVDQYEMLKKKILDAIVNYAMGPKIVLNRLCITLSAYILYTIPQHWPNAFNELLTSFQPQHLPNIQPERVIWILLEILTLIPEEFSVINFVQAQKNIVRNELQKASEHVQQVLEVYTSSAMQNSYSNVEMTTYLTSARCVSAWSFFGGISIEKCGTLITHLLEICSNCYWQNSQPDSDGFSAEETELVEATLSAVGSVLTHAHTDKYPTLVVMQLRNVMDKLVKIIQTEREKPDPDMNIQVPIYSLIIQCAETHSKILIQNLLKKGSEEYELSLWIIHTILMCTDTKGVNPIDEECSSLTFGFWYLLQDEVFHLDSDVSAQLVHTVKPFYRDLISILLRKSMLPSNDEDPKWSAESKEILRCHRQDIADTMMYSLEILSMDLLGILHEKLVEALHKCTDSEQNVIFDNWPYVEACLHAYFAIAEHFESEEETHLPRLMEILTKIPYAKLHSKVLATALDIIGAYSSWINEHPFVLSTVLPLLLLGLQNSEVATSATMALKDISRECQDHISPYATQILQTSQTVLQNGTLNAPETVRLMFSIGKVLSVLPLPSIMEFLNIILTPILEEFQEILNQRDFGKAAKSNTLVKLRMISMLFSTLDVNRNAKSVSPQMQPTLLVLQKIMPLFSQLAGKLCEDSDIMSEFYLALKYAVVTLMNDCKPVVNDILQILVNSYRTKPLSSALDLSKQLMLMFGKDDEYSQTMHLLLCEVVNVTLNVFGGTTDLSSNADVLEAFFNFLTQLFKKNPALLIQDGVNMMALFQCAILCLGIPESPTVKAAAGFLVKFIFQSRESDGLVNTIHANGEALVVKVLVCIGGESPRSGLDPFSDILLALNKKYCDYLARWLTLAISQEGFPSVLATPIQKENFVKSILKEKANKRKIQEIVKEFALICRGLVGIEFGNQTNLFL